jgi:hypothetical protein
MRIVQVLVVVGEEWQTTTLSSLLCVPMTHSALSSLQKMKHTRHSHHYYYYYFFLLLSVSPYTDDDDQKKKKSRQHGGGGGHVAGEFACDKEEEDEEQHHAMVSLPCALCHIYHAFIHYSVYGVS